MKKRYGGNLEAFFKTLIGLFLELSIPEATSKTVYELMSDRRAATNAHLPQ